MKLNKVVLIGRIAQDLELKKVETQDGSKSVCNFRLAVTRDRKNKKTGDYGADFISCVIWGKQAENLYEYQKKGKLILVTGRIQVRDYDNQEGKKQYVTEVLADDIKYMEKISHAGSHITEETPPPPARASGRMEEPPEPAEEMVHDDYPEDGWPPIRDEQGFPQSNQGGFSS
ncbi:single-stranded DNA-binding protein [Listeria sp. ILCC797]|uniref:single-stranded DNA-binding protein n=1 Tax=Listeria sp. ILCC797 TaxID=1918333 RepID=UPI000B596511|nr:single-stranded DNA-binding protein [Listeria sp. ILCC797]